MASQFATIDDYISSCPADVQVILERVRQAIRAAVPDTGEAISYQMPTITLDGRSLVHFAAWKNHIGLYPIPGGDDAFDREIAPYKAAKATVQFQYAKPIPYDVIGRMAVLLAEQRVSRPA